MIGANCCNLGVFNVARISFQNAVADAQLFFLRGPVYSRHYACAILLCGKWCVHQYLSLVEKCVSHEIGGGINTGVVLVTIRMFE